MIWVEQLFHIATEIALSLMVLGFGAGYAVYLFNRMKDGK